MAAKYFVWGEGVWRELDVASGRVSGWRRRARFVYVRRGRLVVARRRPVLRALEELAVGHPSATADGPRLSYRSKSESHTKRKHETPAVPAVPPVPAVAPAPPALPAPPAPPVPPPACHHHCCAHRCNDDERPPGTRDRATQSAPSGAGPSALVFNVRQKHNPPAAPDYSSAEEFVSTSARRPSLAARRTSEVKELFGKTPANEPPATAADKKHTPGTSHPADKSGDERRERARKRPRAVVSDNTDSTSVDEPLQRSATTARQTHAACKELIITDEDVELLRGYVSRTNASALQRFDSDDAYKRLLFYAINPLVQLERCARLECLLHTHSLGLAPARPYARPAPRSERSERPAPRAERSERPAPRSERSERPAPRSERSERSASADTDKENKDRHSSPNKVREPVGATKKSPEERPAASEPAPPSRLGVSERSNKLEQEGAVIKAPETVGVARDPARAKPERGKRTADIARGTHVISKRATQPGAKEYSNLEDHAIVAWLSGGSRACLVSGNRVWRELQGQYERLTGRARSWHSLRNRYLRYILPALGALQLPPADVSRLRAAAATGAIKTKNRLAARRLPALQTQARGSSSRGPTSRGPTSRGPTSRGPTSRGPAGRASSDDTWAAANDDANGPSSTKRRSLRSRPPESASKDTSNKDESGNESASEASGSKELSSKASGSKELSSKASGSKELSSKASGSNAGSSKVKESGRAARSPRYSEVTRRFAARRRASCSRSPPPRPAGSRSPPPPPRPAASRSPSPVLAPTTRSRRLFNPNTNV